MRYHDHALCGYEVRDFGGTIILRLSLRAEDGEVVRSEICFEEVAFYHFIHTSSAIILDIAEIPLARFVARFEKELPAWDHRQGVWIWRDDSANTLSELQRLGLRAWEIDSAVGFTGWVVAKEVRQME